MLISFPSQKRMWYLISTQVILVQLLGFRLFFENRVVFSSPMLLGALFTVVKSKAIQVVADGWTDKQNVVVMYNGVLFSLEKEILKRATT